MAQGPFAPFFHTRYTYTELLAPVNVPNTELDRRKSRTLLSNPSLEKRPQSQRAVVYGLSILLWFPSFFAYY
jgi:hypothetical protein